MLLLRSGTAASWWMLPQQQQRMEWMQPHSPQPSFSGTVRLRGIAVGRGKLISEQQHSHVETLCRAFALSASPPPSESTHRHTEPLRQAAPLPDGTEGELHAVETGECPWCPLCKACALK